MVPHTRVSLCEDNAKDVAAWISQMVFGTMENSYKASMKVKERVDLKMERHTKVSGKRVKLMVAEY
jgi:hypothetical protein